MHVYKLFIYLSFTYSIVVVVVFIIYCDSFSYGNFCHQSRQHIRLGTNFCEWTCQIERDQYIEDSLKHNLHQLVSETESEKRNILSVSTVRFKVLITKDRMFKRYHKKNYFRYMLLNIL